MTKLYELHFGIEAIWEQVEDILTGDVTTGTDGLPVTPEMALDWIEEALSKLEGERDAKALNIACLIKNFRADAEALKTEKTRLAKRQQAAERTVERLTKYLSEFLPAGQKLADTRAKIGWRKSERVVLSASVDELDEEYVRVKREPDLSLIKADLKAGEYIEGAVLETHQNLQIG